MSRSWGPGVAPQWADWRWWYERWRWHVVSPVKAATDRVVERGMERSVQAVLDGVRPYLVTRSWTVLAHGSEEALRIARETTSTETSVMMLPPQIHRHEEAIAVDGERICRLCQMPWPCPDARYARNPDADWV